MREKFSVVILVLMIICAICISVCAGQDAEPASLYGDYILYSMVYSETQMNPGSMGITSIITLNEDGTGAMDMNGGTTPLAKWTLDGETITLVNQNGDEMPCGFTNGIIALEMSENYIWYYAHESLPEAGNPEPSHLSEVFEKIDAAEGAHLQYEYSVDYMNSISVFDVHAKDGSFYSLRTTKLGARESHTVICFLENTAYDLYPDDKTGSVVAELSTDVIAGDVLMLDDLYKAIHGCALRRDFTEETREIDGVSYKVEFFPGSGFDTDAAFYYDEQGNLVHILTGVSAMNPDLGDIFYTIHGIGTDFDSSLFDISGYTIGE